jgi:Mg2+-importing ATPase
VFDEAIFAVLLYVSHSAPAEFRTAWFVESLLTELVVALIVRTRRTIHESRPGALLLDPTIAIAATALAIPSVSAAALPGFVPPPVPVVAAMIAIAFARSKPEHSRTAQASVTTRFGQMCGLTWAGSCKSSF